MTYLVPTSIRTSHRERYPLRDRESAKIIEAFCGLADLGRGSRFGIHLRFVTVDSKRLFQAFFSTRTEIDILQLLQDKHVRRIEDLQGKTIAIRMHSDAPDSVVGIETQP